MAKSRAQQAAIAIAKMKKEELTELIREALREVKEGNAFVDAARKAKEAGEEEFEFDGKVHKVQEVEASLAEEADTEIKVGNYQTKHYHICPGAKTLYQDIEDKVEDMDLAERTAKLQDALFAIEMRALEDGAVQADLDAAEIIADQIMAMAQMMGLEKEHHYIQGHIDKIKGAVENVDEANKEIIVGNPQGDSEEARKDQTIPSQFRTKVADTIKRSQKGDVVTVPTMEEMISVGHVDDEPGMLKQFAFDTAQYAAKLYKLLHHYEQMEDHVDFPNWWQHKVMMAREYMSKATHYLEFETMKPQIDAAVDGHSEEELAEDYVPHTKEDLVFQYLRDAWQFGALKGKDVNPDEELSTMADSLLANLPDYDAAELSELFGRAKNKIVNYQGHDYEILDIDNAGTFTLIDPKHKFYVNKNQMKQGRVPDVKKPEVEDVPLMNLREDDEAEPSKKDIKAAEKETGGKKTHFTPEAQKMHNIIKNKVAKIEKKIETGDDYKLDLAALKQYISKPEVRKALGAKHIKGMVSSIISETITEGVSCCGRCGRVHESAQDCKKPYISKDSPRHCKNKK